MSDPTPVPLDEIERLADECEEIGDVLLLPSTTRALCEALRIAVEGLAEMAGGCDCGLCSDSISTAALAAVCELVDLGGPDV